MFQVHGERANARCPIRGQILIGFVGDGKAWPCDRDAWHTRLLLALRASSSSHAGRRPYTGARV